MVVERLRMIKGKLDRALRATVDSIEQIGTIPQALANYAELDISEDPDTQELLGKKLQIEEIAEELGIDTTDEKEIG